MLLKMIHKSITPSDALDLKHHMNKNLFVQFFSSIFYLFRIFDINFFNLLLLFIFLLYPMLYVATVHR